MKTSRKILIAFAALGVTAALLLSTPVWKTFVAGRLQAMLEKKGFEGVHLTLSELGWRGATFKDITAGKDRPITLKNVTILYSPRELWRGNIRELTLDGLAIGISKDKDKWGLQNWKGGDAEKANPLPLEAQEIAAIPFDYLRLNNSLLTISDGDWKLDIPLEMEWRKSPAPSLSVVTEKPKFRARKTEATGARAEARMTLDEAARKWQGNWQVQTLQIEGTPDKLPPLEGKGTLTASHDTITLAGDFSSKDNAYRSALSLDYPLAHPEQAKLVITSASMPWNGGTLSVGSMPVPLSSDQPVSFTLHANKVSLDALMQAMTGKRVTATGAVSGSVPVTIRRDGSFSLGKGDLRADGPGTITMPPDAIPGDNEQVATVREILKNFHYEGLSIAVNNDKNGLAFLVTLQGNNPDVYNGRPVKLNVRLAGDLLDYIKQNVLLYTQPETLLNRGQK